MKTILRYEIPLTKKSRVYANISKSCNEYSTYCAIEQDGQTRFCSKKGFKTLLDAKEDALRHVCDISGRFRFAPFRQSVRTQIEKIILNERSRCIAKTEAKIAGYIFRGDE